MTWALYAETPHMAARIPLWEKVRDFSGAETVLYPGSYVDVSPSFVFPHVTYVDMDKRCPKFFFHNRENVPNEYVFIHQDYLEPMAVAPVDLLISQYAGPISDHCGDHVKPGGHLLANNSHADAGLAALDPNWELVGTLQKNAISTENLAEYFQPKPGRVADPEEMRHSQKGVAYTKTAQNYLFQRKSS